jgi:monothiol glutaredoxin
MLPAVVLLALVTSSNSFALVPSLHKAALRPSFLKSSSEPSSSEPSSSAPKPPSPSPPDLPPYNREETLAHIDSLIASNPIVLFMKGTKLFPQCGFSNTAVQILNTYGIPFHTVDILADPHVRTGIKEYSKWPTIPQLYVDGQFIGGCDIMIEEYKSGELGKIIDDLSG